MNNLEWLFPTSEPIHIEADTNFILLPLPLPTFFQYTHENLYGRVPHLTTYKPNSHTAEWIRDIDFQEDNYLIKGVRNIYNHMNSSYKNDLINNNLDNTSYLRVYKYLDISPADYKLIKNYITDTYSLADIPPSILRHKLIERKLTLLEITSYNDCAKTYQNKNLSFLPKSKANSIRLKNYCQYLSPLVISTSNFIDVNTSQYQYAMNDIIDYFKKNNYLNYFSVPELKSGLRKLNQALSTNK